jgi:hypothetical protein
MEKYTSPSTLAYIKSTSTDGSAKVEELAFQLRKDKKNLMLLSKRVFVPISEKGSFEYIEIEKPPAINPNVDDFSFFSQAKEYLLQSHTEDEKHDVIQYVLKSKLFGCIDINAKQLMDSGYLALMLQLCISPYLKIAYKTLWSINNMLAAKDGDKLGKYCVENEIVQKAIWHINYSEKPFKSLSFWVLANIAGGSPDERQALFEANIEKVIIPFLNNTTIHSSLLERIAFLISNLCMNKPLPKYDSISVYFPYLIALLNSSIQEVKKDILTAIGNITNSNEKTYYIKFVTKEVITRLLEFFYIEDTVIVAHAVRIIGDISADSNEQQMNLLLDCGLIEAMRHILLIKENIDLKREACWLVSNLAAENSTIIALLIESEIIDIIIKECKENVHVIQRECVFALLNLFYYPHKEQFIKFISDETIDLICKYLSANMNDEHIVKNTIESTVHIVRNARLWGLQAEAYAKLDSSGLADILEALLKNYQSMPDKISSLIEEIDSLKLSADMQMEN